MFEERKASYKAPPALIRDISSSQAHRRTKALEEQKRRRAERFDSARQLDLFADLTLGASEDEGVDENDSLVQDEPEILREGVSQFASMLQPSANVSSELPIPSESAMSSSQNSDVQSWGNKRGKNKRKGKPREAAAIAQPRGSAKKKQGKWADKCMYAELLEMVEEIHDARIARDGIPDNIETGWVAVTPVPVGKRCLAVIHQTSGIAGVVPNLTLRSRVLGKPLMQPFPSPLPPETILDCILDANWRDNGILHVLDVLKWKGQDITECETLFRLWWRDTRLAELPAFPPPPSAANTNAQSSSCIGVQAHYQFPHPASFVPVPYHTDTTLAHLANDLIPLTRSVCSVTVAIPSQTSAHDAEAAMDLDGEVSSLVQLETMVSQVQPDGMLLYVSQATYEPGTTPLSSWIPLKAYEPNTGAGDGMQADVESPLAVFERLINKRLALRLSVAAANSLPEVSMDAIL
ncbi:hypothetical protein WOLCODRAFT_139399 [Wolfiporia cocos MD-104 SS10]|uniref:Snurportin-1 n=1 Tax=Wolfiporia cocos (strain MD-104) TaxID=742152 RepID=A0A2H3JSJ7_WOLCO|nr:hypothetical protein WOLCODRAFT_139399 [Wolfiporia cocos MD-104 SS10]